MSCFDNNVIYGHQSSSNQTYFSYICKSQDTYLPNRTETVLSSTGFNHLWNAQAESFTPDRSPQNLKLRNILTETISNIAQGNKLQKGDSVELTLEIELMKTGNNTPTNSFVEVTIIQHNKTNENIPKGLFSNQEFMNKVASQVDTKSSFSESASQRRKNWFHRVINRQYKEMSWNKELPYPAFVVNNSESKEKKDNTENPRKNFVTILPKEISDSADYEKGYRRVSPSKSTRKKKNMNQNSKNSTTSRKNYLGEKLSEIFLSPKKADKSKTVRTALKALKNEVDSINKQSGINNKNKNSRSKITSVHNLGMLVDNIVGIMENSESTSPNKMKNNSTFVSYQHFFDPVRKTQSKDISKLNETTTNPVKNRLGESHSESCCVRPLPSNSMVLLKPSNSTNTFKTTANNINEKQTYNIGDSVKGSISNYKKKNKPKSYLKKQSYAKGDNIKGQSNIKSNKNTRKISNSNKLSRTKNSCITWEGYKIPVNKEMKERIELTIVNELQNLALKEGMECDITPLPSTDYSVTNIEKIASFICELDVSDGPKLRDNEKKIANSNNKVVSKRLKHKKKCDVKQKLEKKDKTSKQLVQISTESTFVKVNKAQDLLKISNTSNETSTSVPSNKEVTQSNDIEVKYLNTNIKNWSTESNTLMFDMKQPKCTNKTHDVNEVCSRQNLIKDTEASGFVKRITSNDSTWKDFLFKNENEEKVNDSQQYSREFAISNVLPNVMEFCSTTSNECASSIEIELNIKDLEMIVKEAKEKQNTDKIIISAKCKHDRKINTKLFKFTGKNSPSYTNQLLLKAAKKLEKYVKIN